MRKPHVRLAIMAKCPPEMLQRAVNSARRFVDSACILIAPKDYGTLPSEGFGYMSLETKVVQFPWSGFSKTRAELLRRAEEDHWVDWVLMMDADDVFTAASYMPDLEASTKVDSFEIPVELRGPGYRWRWIRAGHLMRARRGFSWIGAAGTDRHEVLINPYDTNTERHEGLVYTNVYDPRSDEVSKRDAGARGYGAEGNRYLADAELLKAKAESCPRAMFYYAQSLKDGGQLEEAIGAFQKRVQMTNGHPDETFWAQLWIGRLGARLGLNPVNPLMKAHALAPKRAEPLFNLEHWYREGAPVEKRDQQMAHHFGTLAAACPYPRDTRYFVELNAYHPDALREAGIAP